MVNLIMNEYAYYGRGHIFIPLGKLNGIPTLLMINQFKLEANRELLPLMDIQTIGM